EREREDDPSLPGEGLGGAVRRVALPAVRGRRQPHARRRRELARRRLAAAPLRRCLARADRRQHRGAGGRARPQHPAARQGVADGRGRSGLPARARRRRHPRHDLREARERSWGARPQAPHRPGAHLAERRDAAQARLRRRGAHGL
ncbi:MAG: hypothetical protein AVDCRST_MAG47-2548, partial [uncultured Nocardioidaceae bacterium]